MSNIGENNIVDIMIGNTPVDKGYLGEVLVYEKTIEYIPFVNDDIKSICCLNWGTYNEIVTVDNGDNTVTITTTKIEKLNTTVKSRTIVSVVTRAIEEGDVIGTVKEPVGMTYKQAAAVTSIGTALKGNTQYYNLDNEFNYLACINGIVDNIYHNQKNRYGKVDSNYYALPYVRVNPGDSITFNTDYIILYKKDFVSGDYWSAGSTRTIKIGSNIYLMRASIQKSKESTRYIKNNTTGEYYYKGADVT